jgi:hypothetical protein
MSAEKMETRDPATQCCWPDAPTPCADMRILWDLRSLLRQECQKLHWKSGHKMGCKRKGVWISLFNIPRIAKSLMPVDNSVSTEV